MLMKVIMLCCSLGVWHRHVPQPLAASRMILKIHIDVAGNHAGNIYMFESTGAGTLQILIDKLNSLSTKNLSGKSCNSVDYPCIYGMKLEKTCQHTFRIGSKRGFTPLNYGTVPTSIYNMNCTKNILQVMQ